MNFNNIPRKSGETVNIVTRVAPQFRKKLNQIARSDGYSVQKLVQLLLEDFVRMAEQRKK